MKAIHARQKRAPVVRYRHLCSGMAKYDSMPIEQKGQSNMKGHNLPLMRRHAPTCPWIEGYAARVVP